MAGPGLRVATEIGRAIPTQLTPDVKAEKCVKLIEKELPNVRQQIGKYWDSFKYELAYVLQEYNVDISQIKKYLEANAKRIDRAVEMLDNKFRDRDENQLRYVVISLFIASYLHGIMPELLLAIGDQESDFKFVSKATGIGVFQLTTYSAVAELQHPNKTHKASKMRRVSLQSESFGGYQLTDIVRGPRVKRSKDGIVADRADMVYLLQDHALYNAIWASRTFLLKTSRGGDIAERSDLFDKEKLRTFLENYNGSGNKEEYATDVLKLYEYYRTGLDNAKKKDMMNIAPQPNI